MKRAGLLTGDAAQVNFDTVVGHLDLGTLASALYLLNWAGLLTGEAAQSNFDVVAAGCIRSRTVASLIYLNDAGLLRGDAAQANFDKMMRHQDLDALGDAIRILNLDCLFMGDTAQANFDAVAGHLDPSAVASVLTLLNRAGLLTGDAAQANRDVVAGHQTPYALVNALALLSDADLLTGETAQANFDALSTYSAILFGPTTRDLWSRITTYELTAEQFHHIIQIAAQHRNNVLEGQAAVVQFVNKNILYVGTAIQGLFNEGQSTHTVNVHQSVSARATKLLDCYGTPLSGNSSHELMRRGDELQIDNLLKTKSEKRCFKRLPKNDFTKELRVIITSSNKNAFFQPQQASTEEPLSEELLPKNNKRD